LITKIAKNTCIPHDTVRKYQYIFFFVLRFLLAKYIELGGVLQNNLKIVGLKMYEALPREGG